jgi:hypothetical protein
MNFQTKTMAKLLTLFSFVFALNISFCQPYTMQKIEVGQGPEDFALDTFNQRERFIISCSSRRSSDPKFKEIVAMDIQSEKITILPRKNEPTDLYFSPHGIDLVMVNGTLKLFVVNHAENDIDQILIYEVKDDFIEFESAIHTKDFISLNSVAALPNGSFYVTNDSGKKNANFEKLFALRKSSVAYYDAKTGLSKIVKKKLAYANGLAVKGNKLYISTTQKKDLLEMEIAENGDLTQIRKLPGVKGMDNITIFENYLIIPCHPKFMKFIKHMKNADKFSPAEVYAFNLENGKFAKIFNDSGENISAPATALYYKGNLYIGQVFNNHLLKVSIPELVFP